MLYFQGIFHGFMVNDLCSNEDVIAIVSLAIDNVFPDGAALQAIESQGVGL